jgi:hypothetical protein
MSQEELSKLYSYISNPDLTFEKISKLFNEEFNNESRKKAITTIIILLKDNLINISQRIICYFILYDTSQKDKNEINPFIYIILDKLKNSNDAIEQNFLIDFLYKKITYLNKTINEYINEKPKEMKINPTQIIIRWEKFYEELLRKQNIKNNSRDKISPIIRYRVINKDINNIYNIYNFDINNQKDLNLKSFENDYMSFRPTNNQFIYSEPVFLLPNLNHCFLWEK